MFRLVRRRIEPIAFSSWQVPTAQGNINRKAHPEGWAFHKLCRRSPNLPHTYACSTIGPTRLNFRVRDGNGWDPRSKLTGNFKKDAPQRDRSQLNRLSRHLPKLRILRSHIYNYKACVEYLGTTFELNVAQSKFYGQAERAISTGKLHALLRFHLQPINLVVF